MVSEKKLDGAEQKESLLASSNLDLGPDTIPKEKKEFPKANKKGSKDKTNLKNKKKKGNSTETQEETEVLLKEENEGSVLNESALSEKDDVTLSDFKAESPKEIFKFDMNENSALDAFLESENEDKNIKKDLVTERQELLVSEDTSLHMSSSGILTPDPKNSPELSETNENEKEKANRKTRAPLPIQISKAALAEPKVDNGMAPGVSSSGKVHDIQEAHKGQPMGLPAEYDVTIIQAAQLGNIIAIEYLLEKNANVVNEKDSGGCSPLHWAAINNRIEAARFLLKNGAEVDAQGGDLRATPLHWACRQGLLDMMVVLLEYGADPTLKDSQGFNIVHLSIHSFNFMSLIYALSLPGLPVDIADGQGHTPLMWAAYQGFSQAVELLLKFEADINARDCTRYTPLHWGVVKGDEGIIQKLIMARADLMAVDGQGQTPSDVAVVSKTEAAWLAALRATGYDPVDLSKPTKRWTTEQVKRAALILPAPIMSTVMLTLVNFPWEMALPMVIMQMWLFYHFGIKKLLNRCSPALCLQESPYHVGIFLTTVAFTFLTYLWSIAPATFNAHPWQNMLFSSLFATSLYFYWLTTTGDPGFLPSNLSLTDHKELLQKLVQDGRLTVRHFCTSCLAQRPIRSKHCRFCNRCVARFDHHCPWNYNCIGASNHRDFVIFTVSLALGILMFEHLGLAYLDLQSAEYAVMELPCILSENICSYFQQEPFLTFTLGWNALQLFWLSMVVVYQLYLIARSTTTNESINHDKYSYFVSSPEQTTPTEPNAINRLASYIHPRAGNVSPRRQFRNPFDRGFVANCLSFWLQRPTPSYWSQIYDTPTEILDVGNPYASVPLNDLGSINDTNRHDDSELVEDGFLDSSLFPSSRADVVSNSRH